MAVSPAPRGSKTWIRRLAIAGLGRWADAALVGSALATAAGSVLFAGAMLMRDHAPGVNGLEYLAIFARPRSPPKALEAAADKPALATADIDDAPVGSIGRVARPSGSGYAIVAAELDFAWLRDGVRTFAVRPGDTLPGLGRVSAIMRRDGRWTLVGDAGAALLSTTDGGGRAPPQGPFGRRMIFGP